MQYGRHIADRAAVKQRSQVNKETSLFDPHNLFGYLFQTLSFKYNIHLISWTKTIHIIIVVSLKILLFRFEINDKKKLITSVSLRHRLQILTENGEQKPVVSTDHPLLAHSLLETEVHYRRGFYFIWWST